MNLVETLNARIIGNISMRRHYHGKIFSIFGRTFETNALHRSCKLLRNFDTSYDENYKG